MECDRCGGLMVLDDFTDRTGLSGHMWIRGSRCINCGEIRDPLVDNNRTRPRPELTPVVSLVQHREEAAVTEPEAEIA